MLKLIILLLTSSMTVMAGAAIAPDLPKIQEFFAIPDGTPEALQVKLLLTIPALFTAIGGVLSGLILDRWGRKWPMAAAVVLYGLAGSSGLWLNDIGSLLVGRVCLGLAVAMIATGAATLCADYFQGPERTRMMGFQAAAMGVAGVVVVLLGGAMATQHWRFPFLIYLFAFIVLPLILQLPESDQTAPLHFELPDRPDGPPTLPIGKVGAIYALTVLTMMICTMVPVQLPFYIQAMGFGGSWEAGEAIALCTLMSAIAALGYAQLRASLSFSKVLLCLFCLLASGYGILAHAPSYGIVILGLLIAGTGIGLWLPNLNLWLATQTPVAQRGQILGGLTSCLFLGQFISPIAIQPIAENFGLQSAYTIAAGILFLVGLMIAAKLVLTTPSVIPQRQSH
jgi:MFS family permease